jgi:ankyrin repeat protein
VVTYLLSRRARVDSRSVQDGVTPLHLAAAHHRMELVETLLEYGSDPNLLDEKGSSAIHYALLGVAAHQQQVPGNNNIFAVAGPGPQRQRINQDEAEGSGLIPTLELLLKHGAKLTGKELLYACAHQDRDLFNFLQKHGVATTEPLDA